MPASPPGLCASAPTDGTAELAARLAGLAERLERRHRPAAAREFLIRCAQSGFAEHAGLRAGFAEALARWRSDPAGGRAALQDLWRAPSGDLEGPVLDLDTGELDALRTIAAADWRAVSPAIFGTLVERALSPVRRQRLGAYYTGEADLRHLVERTLGDPLRADWHPDRAHARDLAAAGDLPAARALLHAARRRLASARVLDPACGAGNFLCVALAELAALQAEVAQELAALGDPLDWPETPGEAVHPSQLFGLELDPGAARIAGLALAIAHVKALAAAGRLARASAPLQPGAATIRRADALLSGARPIADPEGAPELRARGVASRRGARVLEPVVQLAGAAPTPWPAVEYIVGNPPFVGNKRMRDVLGPGYVAALRAVYPEVPGSADLVMYWWWRCAALLRAGGPLRRFGLVTTNSVVQPLNRGVVEDALRRGVRLVHAVADLPWYDDGVAVRIAMTVGTCSEDPATLGRRADPAARIHADLREGVDLGAARPLRASAGLGFQGMNLVGDGFVLAPADLRALGLRPDALPPVVRPLLTGRDLARRPAPHYVIDLWGLDLAEAERAWPALVAWLRARVKPVRDAQNDAAPRRAWWHFGRPRPELRRALAGLARCIVTCRTTRRRTFGFADARVVPNTEVVVIARDCAALLAVLSSRVHLAWAERVGGKLGVGNDARYNHADCLGKFPLPALAPEARAALAELGERLDAHRKQRLAAHPRLTVAGMVHAVAQLREGAPRSAAERAIADMAGADALLRLHDEIDRATLLAYGGAPAWSDAQVLEALLDLNAARAAAEDRELAPGDRGA